MEAHAVLYKQKKTKAENVFFFYLELKILTAKDFKKSTLFPFVFGNSHLSFAYCVRFQFSLCIRGVGVDCLVIKLFYIKINASTAVLYGY